MIPPDHRLDHLYFPFRVLVEAALAEANRESVNKYDHLNFKEWRQFETYRSSARQEALYDQGRDDDLPIVTYTPIPNFHGFGLACDSVWWDTAGNPHWDGPTDLWNIYYHCAALQGLDVGGRWKMKDGPHIQAPSAVIKAERPLAKAWIYSIGLTTPY